jgi:putative hydrolase of the HAD superfamily
LDQLVFYKKRAFKREEFKKFIFSQSKPYPPMLELISRLKEKYRFRVMILSNESRAVNQYRIEAFRLRDIADFFLTSCYVHLRKPDAEIFRMALDVAQVPSDQIIYLDNTSLFIEAAAKMGIRGILHEDFASTREKFARWGLIF